MHTSGRLKKLEDLKQVLTHCNNVENVRKFKKKCFLRNSNMQLSNKTTGSIQMWFMTENLMHRITAGGGQNNGNS